MLYGYHSTEMNHFLIRLNAYGRFYAQTIEVNGQYICQLIQIRDEDIEDIIFEGTYSETAVFIQGILFGIERSELI